MTRFSFIMTDNNKGAFHYLLPVFVYCLIIFAQSSFAMPKTDTEMGHIDKLVHMVIYAVLGILIFRAFLGLRPTWGPDVSMTLSMVLATCYGISDEIHQSFVAARGADFGDVLADLTGSVLGVFFYCLLVVRYSRIRKKIPGLTKIEIFIKHMRLSFPARFRGGMR